MKLLIIQNDGMCNNHIPKELESADFPYMAFPDIVTLYHYVEKKPEPFILISEIFTSLEVEFEIINKLLSMSHFHGLLIVSKHTEDIIYSIKCYLQQLDFTNVISVPEVHSLDALISKVNHLLKKEIKPISASKEIHAASTLSIHDMLSKDFISPFCQPKVNSYDEAIVGYEILSRLEVSGTVYPPSCFIPKLNQEGRITDFTYLLIDKTLEEFSQIVSFNRTLSFNVEYQSLSIQDFSDNVLKIMNKHNFPPERLIIEVTENDSIINTNVISNLTKFRIMGCGVSIDDFGMNHSGFSELLKLPFTEIKIDRTFIKEIVESKRAFNLVKALSLVASTLGDNIVAEGVESEAQRNKLREIQITHLQGYLYGKPVSIKEVTTTYNQQESAISLG